MNIAELVHFSVAELGVSGSGKSGCIWMYLDVSGGGKSGCIGMYLEF